MCYDLIQVWWKSRASFNKSLRLCLFLYFKNIFKKNWIFFIWFKKNFVFLNHFNVLISKIIFKKYKKILFWYISDWKTIVTILPNMLNNPSIHLDNFFKFILFSFSNIDFQLSTFLKLKQNTHWFGFLLLKFTCYVTIKLLKKKKETFDLNGN